MDRERRPATPGKITHLSPEERVARGKAARNETPRSSHGRWEPATNRPDPVALLEEQAGSRVPELVPLRYGRMMVSPFTFYRGGGADHGVRPGRHPALGPQRPDLRRRPPVELRRVRLPGAADDVRHQRLRRDPSRSVGVGRQAARGEFRDRRPRPRVHARRPARGRRWPASPSTGAGCTSSRPLATSTSGTPTSRSTGSSRS